MAAADDSRPCSADAPRSLPSKDILQPTSAAITAGRALRGPADPNHALLRDRTFRRCAQVIGRGQAEHFARMLRPNDAP